MLVIYFGPYVKAQAEDTSAASEAGNGQQSAEAEQSAEAAPGLDEDLPLVGQGLLLWLVEGT